MNDQEILEGILKLIRRDDELLKSIAEAIGTDEETLGDFIDFVDIPVIGRRDRHAV